MPKKTFMTGWQILFTTQMFIPFILGATALSVLGSAVFQALTNALSTNYKSLLLISVGSIIVLVIATKLINRIRFGWRFTPPALGKKSPEKFKGLIVLVSTEAIAREAIKYHRATLRYCWLVCSVKSFSVAEAVRSELPTGFVRSELIVIDDVFDPIEIKQRVEKIYADLPSDLSQTDVILDFTGMPVLCSVGAVLACLGPGHAIQYTPGVYDDDLRAMRALPPIEVTLDWANSAQLTANS